jgi:hypothetical protein
MLPWNYASVLFLQVWGYFTKYAYDKYILLESWEEEE